MGIPPEMTWLTSGSWQFDDLSRKRMESAIDLLRGEMILDVGCRDGTFALEVAKRFPNRTVHGFDTDASSIAWANDHAGENMTFFEDDMLTPKMPWTSAYDTVVCMETLEHLPPQRVEDAHNRLLSFLKPGGRLIISVPANTHISDEDHKTVFYRESLYGKDGIRWSETCPHLWMMFYIDTPKSQSSKDGPGRESGPPDSGATS